MRVWRICREPHAADVLLGRGGLVASGRWHTKGRPVVYASESLALCALEVLVHVDRDLAPTDLVRVEIDVPDELDVRQADPSDLPANWDATPAPPPLQSYGDEWLDSKATPVLRVPSSVIDGEYNFLLNPEHADAHRFAVVSAAGFSFDARLVE